MKLHLDVMPMTLVIQNYVSLKVDQKDWETVYRKTIEENDGVFGLANATRGKIIFETRNFSKQAGKPSAVENGYNFLDRNIFKYFNPIMGAIEKNWWSRCVRDAALAGFGFFKFSFKKGRRTFKNLKPIDYSSHYPYRWDFHFWAYPVSTFPTIVFPAFIKFLKEYKQQNAGFDEKGLMACYRIRVESNALLSPSYDEERMTIDGLLPEIKCCWKHGINFVTHIMNLLFSTAANVLLIKPKFFPANRLKKLLEINGSSSKKHEKMLIRKTGF